MQDVLIHTKENLHPTPRIALFVGPSVRPSQNFSRIIHTCSIVKHYGYMHHVYMHHGYMHHGYMYHGYIHHGYMYHGYMHHGYMHHGHMHHGHICVGQTA